MPNSTVPELLSKSRQYGLIIALALAVVALAACGGASSESTPAGNPQTAQETTAVPDGGPASVTDEPAPPANAAYKFELSNATGETVSLASYAGRKNVVLIFYRGFW